MRSHVTNSCPVSVDAVDWWGLYVDWVGVLVTVINRRYRIRISVGLLIVLLISVLYFLGHIRSVPLNRLRPSSSRFVLSPHSITYFCISEVTSFGLGGTGFESHQERVIFFLSKTSRPAFRRNGYWVLFPWGYSGRCLGLYTYLLLVRKLIMSGAIPPLPLHSLMARTRAALSFTCLRVFWRDIGTCNKLRSYFEHHIYQTP